jgi:hypothetical protein
MRGLARLLIGAFALLAPAVAFGQSSILQGGPWTPGHVPMYLGSGSTQAVVQDGGAAGGGLPGQNVNEIGIVATGTGTAPYAGQGTGVLGTNFCDYDAPLNNATGYHYLCLSANANGGGLITFGAAAGASNIPLNFLVNGVTVTFPFSGTGTVTGPVSSTNGFVPQWSGTTGTILGAGLPVGLTGASTIVETTAGGLLTTSIIPTITLGSTALTYGGTTSNISGLTLASPTFSGTVAGAGTIPNSVLANSAVTIGSTSVALGATVTSFSGVTLASPTFSGTVAGAGTIPNAVLANSSVTIGSTSVALGATVTSISGLTLPSPTFSGTVAGSGTVPNSVLVNSSTTINGVACTLGSTCSITATSASMTVGTTTIIGGTSGYFNYNNGGVLGEVIATGTGSVVLATSPSIASPTFTGTVAGAGTIPNAVLANSSVTVNGVSCTLGSSCSPASNLTVGTSTITSGTNGSVEFNNAGVLGEIATTGSGNVVRATSPTLVTPVLGTPTSAVLTNATGYTTPNLVTIVSGTPPVAGTIGEVISNVVVPSSGVSLSNSTATNIVSVSLTAGSWSCSGNSSFLGGSGLAATIALGWISTVSATLSPAYPTLIQPVSNNYVSWSGIINPAFAVGTAVFDLGATTTVFLETSVAFSAGSIKAGGLLACIRKG